MVVRLQIQFACLIRMLHTFSHSLPLTFFELVDIFHGSTQASRSNDFTKSILCLVAHFKLILHEAHRLFPSTFPFPWLHFYLVLEGLNTVLHLIGSDSKPIAKQRTAKRNNTLSSLGMVVKWLSRS